MPALIVWPPCIFVMLALQFHRSSAPCSGNRLAYDGLADELTPNVAAGTRLSTFELGKSCGIVKPTVVRCFAVITCWLSAGPASLNCENPIVACNTTEGEKMCVTDITPEGVIAV